MSIYDKSFVTVLAVSALLVVIAVPLALRKVPRNAVYGFRTCATLASEELWLAANAHFGRGLIAASLCGAALAAGAYLLRPLPPELMVPATVFMMAVPSLLAALATLRYVRAMERSGAR
ncbi:MAG: SdpI family protein [Burkholderiales bacterium]|nr:SdpI family protein [Burkholderiales bacterium]